MKTHPFLKSKAIQYKAFTFGLLIFILFISLAQFASFALIQQHLVSYYGAEPEDISLALLVMYAGIVTFLPIQFRLLRYFTMRNYLIAILLIGVLINIGSFLTHDMLIFTVLRFFQGLSVAAAAGCMLIVIFSIQPGEKSTVIGTSIFFCAILTTSVIIGVLSSWIAVNMNWNFIYHGLIALQLLAVLITFLIFQSKMQQRAYPLYQIDWVGSLFFAIFTVSLAYVMIYGPKLYWFSSRSIILGTVMSFIMVALFLYRQTTIKRPLIDLRAFKYGKFILGLVLLIVFYGVKDTVNILYGYAGGILGWSATEVVQLGLYNSVGVIISIFFSAKLILKDKINVPRLIVLGFFIMLFYNSWMYFSLTPNLSFFDLAIPVFIHGIASGFIFLSIMIFTMSAIPKFTGYTGIIVCAHARFITSLNSISGFYTLQLKYNTLFKGDFLGHLSTEDPNFVQRSLSYQNLFLSKGYSSDEASLLSNLLINKAAGIQSQLLTNRAVFMIGSLLICCALAIFGFFIIWNMFSTLRSSKRNNVTL